MSRIETLDPNAFRPLAPAAAREALGGAAATGTAKTWTIAGWDYIDGQMYPAYVDDTPPSPV